jgi:ubiquitin-protein ligase
MAPGHAQVIPMNPRIRRLAADAQRVNAAFADHPYIRVLEMHGNPPDKYVVEFRVTSLTPDAQGEPVPRDAHRAEVFLPIDYPRRPPFCRMVTPVFHPNIDPQKICIGDHWSAGQRLAELIVRIAEMLCFQSYNTKSPLNAQAAAWALKHVEQLPLQRDELAIGL